MLMVNWIELNIDYMKIAIMQPTYFPWAGYFSLINSVDKFVFLDNVQFDRRSWQQRNQIANGNKKLWITVPVKKKNLFNQKISEVMIEDNKFKKKHLKSIYYSYIKTKYFSAIFPKIEEILIEDIMNLSQLNKIIILKICKMLNLRTEFINAQDLKSTGKKKELLSNICLELGAKEYISVPGSKDYMGGNDEFENKKIKVNIFEFKQKKYKRGKNEFIPNLSILDLLFYNGLDTKKLIINEK